MYPLFWWLAVHKSVVMATRFWNFAKYFTMLSLCSLHYMHVQNIIPNSISRHHLEHWLQARAEFSKASMINNRQRVLVHTYHQCKFFLANAWSKQHSLDVHFHWHLSTGSISVVLGQSEHAGNHKFFDGFLSALCPSLILPQTYYYTNCIQLSIFRQFFLL